MLLSCDDKKLDDIQVSQILKSFLSYEMAIDFTRIIDLRGNELTEIPREIYHFKRLAKIRMSDNKITSIPSERLFNYSLPSASSTRLVRLQFWNNQINHIEAGAFKGISILNTQLLFFLFLNLFLIESFM